MANSNKAKGWIIAIVIIVIILIIIGIVVAIVVSSNKNKPTQRQCTEIGDCDCVDVSGTYIPCTLVGSSQQVSKPAPISNQRGLHSIVRGKRV